MKKSKLAISILAALSVVLIPTGCASNASIDYDKSVKVTFVLDGGSFQNSEAPLIYYYQFKGDGKEHLIHDPSAEEERDRLSSSVVQRAEYTFDGWYRTREEIDGYVVYSGRWDFDKDTVTDDGVTLYAKWNRLIHYTYQTYYIDEVSGELVKLGAPIEVEPGATFKDIFHNAETRTGYTAIGYCDENGEPWDDDFAHPGGDVDTEIKVIVKYTRGEFVEVATAQQLISNYNKDIRLVADIDFEGAEFSGFANYKHLFDGQGHRIMNFKLAYNDANSALDYDEDLFDDGGNLLNISLFGKTENAEVRNVKFENVIIDVNTTNSFISKIIVAPLCVKATDSIFENVSISATYTLTQLPRGFLTDRKKELAIVGAEDGKNGCYFNDGSTLVNISLVIDDQITL